MNNAKTRFIIAITQKLSAAPDSEAKVDMIEELSENLCGRYTDMVNAGTPEDEAFSTALDRLGDVNELLAYLDCCEEKGARPSGPARDVQPDDWFSNLGGLIQQTVDQAVCAANEAAAMVRDVARSFDGGITINRGDKRAAQRADDGEKELAFSSQDLRGIKVSIVGDLEVYLSGDSSAPIRLSGDIDDLEAVTSPNGVLTITQEKSAGGSFFFSRGLSSASIELSIPQRHWEKLSVSTTNGDVDIHDGILEADSLCLKTTSGDIELDSLHVSQRLEVETASGDLVLTDCVLGELVFHSASGDLDGTNVSAAVLAQTASGDVSLSGDIRALKADTASGDLELDTALFPEALELSTKSGDCSVSIPGNSGFVVRFSTVSGDLHSDFPLTAAASARRGWSERSGEAYYKDGGDGRVFSMFSVSGDIELRQN